jgi:hypothetical protein
MESVLQRETRDGRSRERGQNRRDPEYAPIMPRRETGVGRYTVACQSTQKSG